MSMEPHLGSALRRTLSAAGRELGPSQTREIHRIPIPAGVPTVPPRGIASDSARLLLTFRQVRAHLRADDGELSYAVRFARIP